MAGTGGSRAGAGRPPGAVNETTKLIRAAAQKHGPEMIDELVRLAKESESDAARVAAANAVLDRGYGRPKQSVEHSGEDGGPVQVTIAGRIAGLL
jgi:hypothetical protein